MEKVTCLSSSKIVKGYTESKIAKSEKNDCVVRAFAASFNIEYNRAHKFVKENLNRVDRRGTSFTATKIKRLSKNGEEKIFNKKVKYIENLFIVRGTKKSQMSLLTFLRQYNKGTYFVLVRGHALVVKNGVLIGNYDEGRRLKRIVVDAFKIGVR